MMKLNSQIMDLLDSIIDISCDIELREATRYLDKATNNRHEANKMMKNVRSKKPDMTDWDHPGVRTKELERVRRCY